MKLLIVEDELLLAKQLESILKKLNPQTEIMAVTNSIESTVSWLRQNVMPDLILMDIELADGQCFEIFSQYPVNSPVIFTTAYDEFALRAFKVNSIDYLLKPIKETELSQALNKWKLTFAEKGNTASLANLDVLLNELKTAVTPSGFRDRFLIKQGQKMLTIATNDIAFFYAKNTLNFLITQKGQKFVIDFTLDELQQILDPKRFFRANRQYIIALEIISAIHPWFNGKVKVESIVPVEDAIIISRDKAPIFKEWLGA